MKNIENKKMPQMLLFNMCEDWKKIWHHFGLFLSLFSAFHLNFFQLCKKLQSYISGTHQLLFPLVNNGQNWCQKSWSFFSPLLILQGECVLCTDPCPCRWSTRTTSPAASTTATCSAAPQPAAPQSASPATATCRSDPAHMCLASV